MLVPLTSAERRVLADKYVRAHGDDVEILEETLVVETDHGTEKFSVNDLVRFERPDRWSPKQVRRYQGMVVLFIRLTDVIVGRQDFGIILVDGDHGDQRQYRVPVNILIRDQATNS